MSQKSIKTLVTKSKQGDKEAFGELYDQLYDKVFGYTYKRCFCYASACDITNNTFIKLLKNIERFNYINDSAFYAWVYRISSNELANYYKKQNKYSTNSEYFDDDSNDLLEQARNNLLELDESIDSMLQAKKLHKALQKLKAVERRIIELHYLAGLSHKDIASALQLTESNVRVKAHRAIKKLRSILTNNELQILEGTTK